jgi:hypothetical protein
MSREPVPRFGETAAWREKSGEKATQLERKTLLFDKCHHVSCDQEYKAGTELIAGIAILGNDSDKR